jgi:hypothetical protein
MDMYTPSLVPGHTRKPNCWMRSQIGQPRVDTGSICTVCKVFLGVKTIITYAEGPPACTQPTAFWEVLQKWQQT